MAASFVSTPQRVGGSTVPEDVYGRLDAHGDRKPFRCTVRTGYHRSMAPNVLLVDNAVHRLLFRPSWHWKAHLAGVSTHTVHLPSALQPPSLTGYTHIILTGSEASILEHRPWFAAESALIHQAINRGLPVLGSCFGHEMLVYTLSGPEYLRKASTPEVGWADVQMTGEDPLFDGLPNPWRTFVFHFAEVHEPPPPWKVLGRSSRCDTHVIRYGDHPVWGIQAHPEISSRKAKIFLRGSLLLGLRPARQLVRALRNAPPPNEVAETIVRRFLNL